MIRVLLIGCGDVALRTADLLHPKVRLYGLTRRAEDIPRLRSHGVVPIVGLPRVVAAAPQLAMALGYDVDDALEPQSGG